MGETKRRRQFLKSTLVGGVGLLVARRSEAGEVVDQLALEEMPIAQLQQRMKDRVWTSEAVTAGYLARIEAIDRNGPKINSVIEINPDALAIARQLDEERQAGKVRGPLHGVPILIKDNVDTADRMRTTAGSLALADSIAPRDAFIVERLRAAGVVLLGKTNLSEWANFRSSRSISGWSGRGGQTLNPYALDRNPCGSSSGSGAATAASLCAASIGTETDGSIVCPSNASSLVGLKPTVGLVSRAGIIPISATQDTAGPMTRTVTDAAIILNALTGPDPRDPITSLSRPQIGIDYTKFLDPQGLKGTRIGVARDYLGFNPRVDRLIEAAIEVMKERGATIIDPVRETTKGKYDDAEFEVLLYEFKDGLNAYLRTISPAIAIRSIDDVIRFNEENREREMPWFGQETMIASAGKGSLSSPAYRQARLKCRTLSRRLGIDAMLARHRLDAIVAPTGGPAWKTDRLNGDHFSGGFSTAAAVAGYPHITVPAGYIEGMPVGLSIFAGPWTEGRLLRYAYAFEQATRHRRAPGYTAVS